MLTKEFADKLELRGSVNLESYLSYFYEETVTLPQLIEHFSERNGDAYPFHDEGTREVGKTIYFMDEPLRIKEHAEAVEAEFRESMTMRARKGYVLPSQMKLLYGGEEVAARLPQGRIVTLSALDNKGAYFPPNFKSDISVKNVAPYNGSFETLLKDLVNYKKKGYRVLLLSGSRTRAARLAQDLWDQGLTAVYSEDPM